MADLKRQLLHFKKYHGAGNDFVIFDVCHGYPDFASLGWSLEDFVRAVCNRHKGVGADGVVFLETSKLADFKMLYYNADGSRAVCGNGARCVCSFIKRSGLVNQGVNDVKLETDHAIQIAHILGGARSIRVDMGVPSLEGAAIPTSIEGKAINYPLVVGGREVSITAVGMGNPHAVMFVDNVDTAEVARLGAIIETHEFFPERTNVEFVEIVSYNQIKLRVWERGVGETLACGTGACASVVAGVTLGHLDRKVGVKLLGGEVEVTWDTKSNHISLLGPATEVFSGDFDLERFIAEGVSR